MFFPYGVLYIIKVDVFKSIQTFYSDKIIPYFIERWQNYEIDDEIDFYIIVTRHDSFANSQRDTNHVKK